MRNLGLPIRNDEPLNKAILEEVFQLMSEGLGRVAKNLMAPGFELPLALPILLSSMLTPPPPV